MPGLWTGRQQQDSSRDMYRAQHLISVQLIGSLSRSPSRMSYLTFYRPKASSSSSKNGRGRREICRRAWFGVSWAATWLGIGRKSTGNPNNMEICSDTQKGIRHTVELSQWLASRFRRYPCQGEQLTQIAGFIEVHTDRRHSPSS